nr:FHA domain-containing protein [Massilia sp. TS11]
MVRERMTLGRHPSNDIVLEHRAVSARHCVFTCILDDAFLEDLDSTNGTFVNGQRILKHVLNAGDQITVAKYQIAFRPGPRRAAAPVPATAAATPAPPLGQIRVENGANAGKTLLLNKPLTTLGRPGVLVVVVTRGPAGYTVAHIDGDSVPQLNGKPMARQSACVLTPGDTLDLGGTRMRFEPAPA